MSDESEIRKENMISQIMNSPQPLPRRVPDYMRKKGGIWYWTGAMVMFAFFYEVITGLVLLFFYQPSNPFGSSEALVYNVPFGSIMLSTHLYGAYVMIALVYIHLLRNYFVGAYKKPREMQWITGVLLLVLTLGAAFFGYTMDGDVLAKAATSIGSTIAAGTPYIGNAVNAIFFGNGTALSLYSRLLGWHIVMVLLIGVLFAVHFFMAEYNTIMPRGKDVNYRAPAVDTDKPEYKPWYPHNLAFMMELFFIVVAAIVLIPSVFALWPSIPVVFSPFPASPTVIANTPPWFLLFVYKELDFNFASTLLNPFWDTVLFVGAPLLYLLIIPYLDRSSSLRLSDRWIFVALGVTGVVYLVGLSTWAFVYGVLQPTMIVPNYQVAIFFFVPAVLIFLFTYLVRNSIHLNKLKLKRPEVLFTIVGLMGFFSVVSGILIYESYVLHDAYALPGMAAMLTITAILAVISVAIILGIFNPGYSGDTVLATPKTRIIAASMFGALSLFIAIEVSFIKPDSPTNNAYYGIGLAMILLAVAGIIRIYRGESLGE